MKRFALISLGCLLLLSTLACNSLEEVAGSLDAKQSVEMVVSLNRSGVPASREQTASGRNSAYRVLVNREDYPRALEVLHEYGLPRTVDDSLESITRPRGFVPNSPQLSQLRLDHALELRVERALLSLPGVIEARVIVQSDPEVSVFAEASSRRGVSVVVRLLRPKLKSDQTNEREIKELVAQAVPGVHADAVEVKVISASIDIDPVAGTNLVQLQPFSFRVPSAELSAAGTQILVMFCLFCLAGFALGAVWSMHMQAKRRRKIRSMVANEGGRSVFLEASMQENPRTKASLPQVKDTEG